MSNLLSFFFFYSLSLKKSFQLILCCHYSSVSIALQFYSVPVCCQILPSTQPQSAKILCFPHLNLQQPSVAFLTAAFHEEAHKTVLNHSH